MRAFGNDCLRCVIAWTIKALGLICSTRQRLRILTYRTNQKRLQRKYNIHPGTPLLSYGPIVEDSIRNAASKHGPNARFATTSGSTGKPKQILYTRRRLLSLKLTFSDMFARACHALSIKRTSLYVFSSFDTDTSLTSLLLDEDASELPNYLSTLQAPYRVQHHPVVRSLASTYGAAAVRLWLLTMSNPGVIYSTNPSTISTFLDEIARDWPRSSKLIKDWCNDPASFHHAVHKIFRRLESRGCNERLKRVANSTAPLPLSLCAPAVTAYICWTGGYVQPFLDRLAYHLPGCTLIPMYSMSTETVETLPYFQGHKLGFFPIAPGVVYEFLDDEGNVKDQLEPGLLYEMVISDAYGLKRYRTGDLFRCERTLHNLPDLSFVRRRALEYSFTGEKLTGEQLTIVFEQLRTRYPAQLAGRFLTCVPSQPPHYKVLMIGDSPPVDTDFHVVFAASCDALLSEMNCEYGIKRASGRLGPIEVMGVRLEDFVAQNHTWEAQFKFLPLIREPIVVNPVFI
jgi:hypothetical protein